MITTRAGLTNQSRKPSFVFNLVCMVAYLLELVYFDDKYAPEDYVSNSWLSMLYA